MSFENLELAELLKLRNGLEGAISKKLDGTQENAIPRNTFDDSDVMDQSRDTEPGFDQDHDVRLTVPFMKADTEQRLVTGIVLEPDEVDSQNDTIKGEVIEKAAHNFLASFNIGTQMGVMHKMFGEIGVRLAESYIAPVDFKLGGQGVKKGSWLMTVKVVDDILWRKVKSGEITGFSIGGVAAVVDSAA